MGKRSMMNILVVCALFMGVSLFAGAEEAGETGISEEHEAGFPTFRLEQVTVTGLRVPRRLKDTPVFTEVITRSEMERSGATTIDSVLQSQGLMHTQNAMGDYVSIQGLGQGRVLYLVDGRRVPGRVAQRLNGATVPIGDIERVEIVRGAQSALYGSDGMGGVINMVSRAPDENFSLDLRLSNSLIGGYQNPNGSGGRGDAVPLREQTLSSTATFGIGSVGNRLSVDVARGEAYLNETGSRSLLPEMLRGKIGMESRIPAGPDTELRVGGSALAMQMDEQTNIQGSLNRQEINRFEGFVAVEQSLGERTQIRAQAYNHYYGRDRSSYSGITDSWQSVDGEFENLLAADVTASVDVRGGLMITAGAEASYNTMKREMLTLGDADRRVTRNGQALFAQAEFFDEGRYSVVVGLRGERDSAFGLAAAPRIAAMYSVSPTVRLLSGIGVGYRAPDFNDLYLYSDPAPAMPIVVAGNPDLSPEYSIGGNVGAEMATDRLFAQVNVYYTELFDEIVFESTDEVDVPSGKLISRKKNLDRSLRTGVDFESRSALIGPAFVSVGYGFLYGYNRTDGEQIFDQPGQRARARLGVEDRVRGYYAHVNGSWLSAINPNSSSEDETEPRYQVDLYGSYRFGSGISAFAGVENLTGFVNPSLGPFFGPLVTLGMQASW